MLVPWKRLFHLARCVFQATFGFDGFYYTPNYMPPRLLLAFAAFQRGYLILMATPDKFEVLVFDLCIYLRSNTRSISNIVLMNLCRICQNVVSSF